MVDRVILPQDDFPPEHPSASQMLKKLTKLPGKSFELVDRWPTSNAGACYWNVQDHCKQHGGTMRLGWLITWVPNLYIQAMHHGIWESPEGESLDITAPQYRPPDPDTSTFLADSTIKVDLRFPVLIENKHVRLVDDPLVTDALRFYRLNNSASAKKRDVLKALGTFTWDRTVSNYVGPPLPADYFSQIDRKLNETFASLHNVNAQIMQKYFPER